MDTLKNLLSDPLLLARIQFALTAAFHYIYPPMSIGLGVVISIFLGMHLRTGDTLYRDLGRFWIRIFGLVFALGVTTGIVMEFQFGTNWSNYSRFVGDIFGSPLAAEGVFAFFLESGFLAILLFGWNRVSPRMHFISALLVTFGAHLSAVWIVVANSWMQTPAGYRIVNSGGRVRAEIENFAQVVLNPSTVDRLSHVICGAWLAGATLVLAVSAWYLLKNRHVASSRVALRVSLAFLIVASLAQLATGHHSAMGVFRNQPAKLAAFEGHFAASAPAPAYIAGWVDDEAGKVSFGIPVPGLLSLMIHFDPTVPVAGLEAWPREEWPPVNIVFQTYHIMVGVGTALIGLSLLGAFSWWRGTLDSNRWLLALFVLSVLAPHIANQTGWIAAEVGRQPWIVYGLMRTSEAASPVVGAGSILFSILLFTSIYTLLFALFLFLLGKKIAHGPEPHGSGAAAGKEAR